MVALRLARHRERSSPTSVGRANADLETVLLLLNIGFITGFLVFLSYSKHLHIFLAPINVATSRRPVALGPLYYTPDMDMENVTEDTVFGAGHIEDLSWKQLLDTLTCTECGRCQDACPAWNTDKPLVAQAAHHGAARQPLRERQPPLARPTATDDGAGNAARGPHPRSPHDRSRRAVVVCHVRGVCRGMPRRHRARRHHHRDAPLRGAHGVALPERSRPDAAQHREPGRSLGTRARQTHGVDRRSRLRGAGDHRHDPRRHRVPLLGRLCRRAGRTGPQGDPGHGPSAAPSRGAASPSSGPASPARETPPGDSETSTSTRRWAGPTSRRWRRWAPRRWSPRARTASTHCRGSTPTWGATSRSSTTRSSSRT